MTRGVDNFVYTYWIFEFLSKIIFPKICPLSYVANFFFSFYNFPFSFTYSVFCMEKLSS